MNNVTISTRPLEMLLTLNNPVFGCYIYWCSILVIKMLFMSFLTAVQRFRFKAYINPEDLAVSRNALTSESGEPHVDRVRRAHLNDIENILPFFTMGLIYVCTDPGAMLAMMLIRIQAVSRIVHTLVYAFGPVPQPSRAIAFFVGVCITTYMGVYTLCHTIKFI